MSRHSVRTTLLVVLACVMWGCSSQMTMVVPRPPMKYEVLGRTEGSATGSLLIWATAYNFIPILLNSRTERAYRDALGDVPGATGLINVTIHESWFWWVIGSSKTVTVTGDAIKASS